MSDIFDNRRLRSHVRILNGEIPVGSGFVVGERHVMTCAHVIGDSAGRRDEFCERDDAPDVVVTLDMPFAPGHRMSARVMPDKWRRERRGLAALGLDDAAILELVEGTSLPEGAQPVGKTKRVVEDDQLRGYGVGRQQPDGVVIRARYQDIMGPNRFLIWSEAMDEAVRPGCSGAALWSSKYPGLAGMVVEMQQEKTGRVIPVTVLQELWDFEWEPLPPEPSPVDLQLNGLDWLARTRATRHFVESYGCDIARASDCANAVGDLKKLHDLLDQVRHRVYVPLRSLADRSPGADIDRDLSHSIREFSWLRHQLADAADQPSFRPDEFPWLKGELSFAAESLDEALGRTTLDRLADALAYLKQAIEVQLPRLDSRLAEATERLNLAELISKLKALREDVLGSGVAAEKVKALEHDIDTLLQVEVRLATLVASHQAWQQVDSYLIPLETATAQANEDVIRAWRLLQLAIGPACPEGSPERTEIVAKVIGDFSAAVDSRETSGILRSFNTLSDVLRARFFKIDKGLLSECGKIRTVGESLSAVVEKLDA